MRGAGIEKLCRRVYEICDCCLNIRLHVIVMQITEGRQNDILPLETTTLQCILITHNQNYQPLKSGTATDRKTCIFKVIPEEYKYTDGSQAKCIFCFRFDDCN
jgi:hypothetical protein